MDDRWPRIRAVATDEREYYPVVAECRQALAILDAVTAPGTEVFGIRRFPIDGEDGCWMPVYVATYLHLVAHPGDFKAWKQSVLDELGGKTIWCTRQEAENVLALRYEAATALPPPKWETALRDELRQPLRQFANGKTRT